MAPRYFLSLPKRKSTLVENARVILSSQGPLSNASLSISDGRIEAIGDISELRKKRATAWEDRLDASDCLVMPGFVNNHSHIAMAILRGAAEDLPLLSWLKDRIWPLEARLKPWQIEAGATVGAVEALLSGTTSVTSTYFFSDEGSEAESVYAVGLRGTLAHGVFDWTETQALRASEDYIRTWHGKDEGRIRIAVAPHAPYSCSPELLKKIEALRCDLAEKYGQNYPVLSTIHVAEARTERKEIEQKYGVSLDGGIATYLLGLGVLNSHTIASHCIQLTDEDYRSFKESRASIASCPISNLKIGMGVANLPRMIEEGITTSLGTDGPASNNSLDMFETTKLASLLSKGISGDTRLVSSRVAYELATRGGAHSLHQEKQIGCISPGMQADIVLLDLKSISALPFYDAFNHIVYSARAGDVRDVIVDGRILVRNRSIQTVDMEELGRAVELARSELIASAADTSSSSQS